jgi:probable HAF family extracellular repeat protein
MEPVEQVASLAGFSPMKRLLGGLLVLALLLARPGQARADYIFTTIDVPGSAYTVASGINDAGQVVGYYNSHGFLLSNGTYTTLDATGSVVTQALGINNAGQIVGNYGDASGTHGFLLTGGSYTALDVPRSFGSASFAPSGTSANGINDSGQVVGGFQVPVSPRMGIYTVGAFSLSGGVYTNISVPGTGGTLLDSAASGINKYGQIVGSVNTAGFLLGDGNYTFIKVPGSLATGAGGINDAGQIVGGYAFLQGGVEGPVHGFLLSGDSYTTIDVPGASQTLPNGINNEGDIVGYYLDAAGHQHAFLAAPEPVPEPATIVLLGVATLAGLGWVYRRRKQLL